MTEVIITYNKFSITFTFAENYRNISQGVYIFPKTQLLLTPNFSLIKPFLITVLFNDIIFTTTPSNGDNYIPVSNEEINTILNEIINT